MHPLLDFGRLKLRTTEKTLTFLIHVFLFEMIRKVSITPKPSPALGEGLKRR